MLELYANFLIQKPDFSCIQIKLVSFDCNFDPTSPHNYAAINANAVF